MASAVLPSRNDTSWGPPRGGAGAGGVRKMGGGKGKTVKNSNLVGKRQFQPQPQALARDSKDQSQAPAVARSVDPSPPSTNRQPVEFDHSQYVSFGISSCSKKELSELRSRFMAELDQVRQLRDRIESGKLSGRSGQNAPPPKKLSGKKRPLPSNSGEDSKRALNSENVDSHLMKSCSQILNKLMKHKNGWVFNVPVDAEALNLHDYHTIVKNPMDLGTVKRKLKQNLYQTPLDFADDVKLTFNNAVLYNPKWTDVYAMAGEFLARFEELFMPIYKKMENVQRQEPVYDVELAASSWTNVEVKQDSPIQIGTKPLPESSWGNVEPKIEKVKQPRVAPPLPRRSESPVHTPEPARAAVAKPVKQPKPKAKDPNKREMSLEEKHKLGMGLQSLPQEKMEHVVQIISKRNGHLRHDGDEIELDIEAIDTETLWELDRFITNYKKLVSKIKRQALINNTNVGSGSGSSSMEQNEDLQEHQHERIDVEPDPDAKRGDAGDEDVDIDDDMPMNSYAPVEIEKDEGRDSSSSSSSSSSGSDSSSSSDSDSGSSSGSDSEADNPQS